VAQAQRLQVSFLLASLSKGQGGYEASFQMLRSASYPVSRSHLLHGAAGRLQLHSIPMVRDALLAYLPWYEPSC
jgi:hypothetical protein